MTTGKTIIICAALAVSLGFTVGALACEAETAHTAADAVAPGAPDYVMPEAYLQHSGWGETDAAAYCREFQTEALIGGAPHMLYGTACRRPDGSWTLITNSPLVGGTMTGEQHAALNR